MKKPKQKKTKKTEKKKTKQKKQQQQQHFDFEPCFMFTAAVSNWKIGPICPVLTLFGDLH